MNDGLTDEEIAELNGLPAKVVLDLPPNGRDGPNAGLPTQAGSCLAIHARDDQDFSVYLANVLAAAYRAWLNVDGRYHRLGRAEALPFTSRKECRQVLKRTVDRFWEKRTGAKAPRPHIRNEREHCFDLIWDVIYRMIDKRYDPWSPDLPLRKGKPITAYCLAKLMDLMDDRDDPDDKHVETYRKYARLWLLCRRFYQAKPAFTTKELAFLKRADRFFYTSAIGVIRKQATNPI
jgi:hypothetical protein